jgi:AraC-like DNA-binding protein
MILEAALALIGLSWALMGMAHIWYGGKREGAGYALLMVLVLSLPLLQITLNAAMLTRRLPNVPDLHSIPMLFGPFFFFYTKKILNEPLKDFSAMGLHLVPFALFCAMEVIVQASTSLPGISHPLKFSLFIYLHSAAAACSVLIYGSIIFIRTHRYQKTVENHFSSRESDITLSWLKNLASGYILLFGTSFMLLLLFAPLLSRAALSPHLITISPLCLFIFYFSYHSARQRIIVVDTALDRPVTATAVNEEQNKGVDKEKKYEKSALKDTELEELARNLKTFMERSKAYLNSELTLEKLAQRTEIPRHKLSQVLNRELNQTFYSFVNQFRIGEFEELVKSGQHKKLSILGLAYECGFKSSSSFYNTIKKEKGKTPRQIIKELQNEQPS